MRSLTATEVAELLEDDLGLSVVNGWLARGDGVAVYRNEDFGSPDIGHCQFVSFGSENASFPTEPPQQMPDTATINWRYQLFGVYRGKELEPAASHDFADPYVALPLVLNSFENKDLYGVADRLISYQLKVGYEPEGMRNCRMTIRAQYSPPIEGEWVVITLTAPTHNGRVVDRLGPWSWHIKWSHGAIANRTGTDPNLGGAIVSICNLSAKKPGGGT